MLSPCIRQVTHALLTRPPLKFKSLGFIKLPFDLHVLSTPPAFILSQDQTLMLYYLLACRFKLLRKIHLFVLPVLSGITVLLGCDSSSLVFVLWIILVPLPLSGISPFRRLALLEFSGLHYCLFVKVHTDYVFYPSCCCPQRQLCYNIMSASLCQQLFSSLLKLFATAKLTFAVEFYYSTIQIYLSMLFSEFLAQFLTHWLQFSHG